MNSLKKCRTCLKVWRTCLKNADNFWMSGFWYFAQQIQRSFIINANDEIESNCRRFWQTFVNCTTQKLAAICIIRENKADVIVYEKIQTMRMRRRVWEVILSCWISNCSNCCWDTCIVFNSIYWVDHLVSGKNTKFSPVNKSYHFTYWRQTTIFYSV